MMQAPKQTPEALIEARAEYLAFTEDVLARMKAAETPEAQAQLWYDLMDAARMAERLAYQLQAVGRYGEGE
jgi:hypothetical protein